VNVSAPLAVAAMPESEVAVTTLPPGALVTVFDKKGRFGGGFGGSQPPPDRQDFDRLFHIGGPATDHQGHLYYGFQYFPEPTVRQFDRFGYAGEDLRYASLDVLQEAASVRREIEKQERRGDAPRFKQVMTAMGVDKVTGEVWMAMGSTLLRFD